MLFNGFKSCDLCMINHEDIINVYALSLFLLQQSFCIFCTLANVYPNNSFNHIRSRKKVR